MENIKYSKNYNYKKTTKSAVVSTSRIVITDTHIEVYDSEGNLKVRTNKD